MAGYQLGLNDSALYFQQAKAKNRQQIMRNTNRNSRVGGESQKGDEVHNLSNAPIYNQALGSSQSNLFSDSGGPRAHSKNSLS